MRAPFAAVHSVRSSVGHGPERCEWPTITCEARISSRSIIARKPVR